MSGFGLISFGFVLSRIFSVSRPPALAHFSDDVALRQLACLFLVFDFIVSAFEI